MHYYTCGGSGGGLPSGSRQCHIKFTRALFSHPPPTYTPLGKRQALYQYQMASLLQGTATYYCNFCTFRSSAMRMTVERIPWSVTKEK